MAQSGYTPILIYASSTPGALPSAANLTSSASGAELAINYADGKLYFKNSSGVVTLLAGSSSGPAGGSNTQVQYNSSGVLAGSSNLTFDGTSLTLGGNPTLSAGTANGVLYLNGSKVATSGSALTFDGTNTFRVNGGSSGFYKAYSGEVVVGEDSTGIYYGAGAGVAPAVPLYFGSTGTTFQRWQAGGSEQMRLTSTGLGIGTSSPGYKLDVNTVGGSTATARLYGNDQANVRLRLENSGSGGRTWELVGGLPGANNANFSIRDVTGSTTPLTIDSSGNLGLGVTPNWNTYTSVLQLPAGGIGSYTPNLDLSITQNAYYNSGWKYSGTGAANRLNVQNGAFNFYTAPSGTAGNAITFTQVMTLDSSGNLGIGQTNPSSKLEVTGVVLSKAAGNAGRFDAQDTNSGGAIITINSALSSAGTPALQTQTNHPILFAPNNTERMRLDSSGNLGLGVTPSAWDTGNSVRALQLTQGAVWGYGSANMYLAANNYWNGANRIYLSNNTAGEYRITGNVHAWMQAASGTAGNAISFTQAMTLDASGNLLVGGTGQTTGGEKVLVSNYSDVNSTVKLGIYAGAAGNKDLDFYSNGNSQFFTAARIRVNSDIYTDTGCMAFWTTSNNGSNVLTTAERARITSEGYFKASNNGAYSGSTAAYHEFYQTGTSTVCYFRATNASYAGAVIEGTGDRTTTNASYYLIDVYNGNISGRFRVTDAGNCQNTNNSYGGTSDIKLKQDIVDASSQWDDIKNLRVRKYRFKNKPDEALQIGVIAQELEQVSPGLVEDSVDRDKEGNDLGTTTKSVKYSILYMKAVKALQEAMARIETLEAKVSALEGN